MMDEILEALFEHANHNKRLPGRIVSLIKKNLDSPEFPMLVSPSGNRFYRGDVTSPERFQKDIGTRAEPQGKASVVLTLEPGSSWSYNKEQAEYHATPGSLTGGVSVIYTASPRRGIWLDMRELYKLSEFRGLRLEREVIGLDSKISCTASWVYEGKTMYSYDYRTASLKKLRTQGGSQVKDLEEAFSKFKEHWKDLLESSNWQKTRRAEKGIFSELAKLEGISQRLKDLVLREAEPKGVSEE